MLETDQLVNDVISIRSHCAHAWKNFTLLIISTCKRLEWGVFLILSLQRTDKELSRYVESRYRFSSENRYRIIEFRNLFKTTKPLLHVNRHTLEDIDKTVDAHEIALKRVLKKMTRDKSLSK